MLLCVARNLGITDLARTKDAKDKVGPICSILNPDFKNDFKRQQPIISPLEDPDGRGISTKKYIIRVCLSF